MKETPLSHNRHFCRQHGDNTFFLKCEQCSGRLRRYLVLCVFRDQLKRISRIDYVRWKCGMRSSFSHFFSYPRQQALISHTGTGITDTSSADFFPCFYAPYKRLKKLLALIQKHTAKKKCVCSTDYWRVSCTKTLYLHFRESFLAKYNLQVAAEHHSCKKLLQRPSALTHLLMSPVVWSKPGLNLLLMKEEGRGYFNSYN